MSKFDEYICELGLESSQMEKLQLGLHHLEMLYRASSSDVGERGKGPRGQETQLTRKKLKPARDKLAKMVEATAEMSSLRVNYVAPDSPPSVIPPVSYIGAQDELIAAHKALSAALAKYDTFLATEGQLKAESPLNELRDGILRLLKQVRGKNLEWAHNLTFTKNVYKAITGYRLGEDDIKGRIKAINKE